MSELPWTWVEYGVEVSDFADHESDGERCNSCCCGSERCCACGKLVHCTAVDEVSSGDDFYWMHAYWCEGCGAVPNPDGPDPC